MWSGSSCSVQFILLIVLSLGTVAPAQDRNSVTQKASTVQTKQFDSDVTEFLGRQIEAHVADITTLHPPPDRVMGALTVGEFSWGAFSRALASYSVLSGRREIAGRDVPKMVGQIGLIESAQGGKTFAQLYSGIALISFGADLKTNPVWQLLTPAQQKAWLSLLDPSRFYDRKTRHVINLPENYFGVAARVVSMDYKLGIITDKAFVDDVIDRAAQQFVGGSLYSDDALPTGRFDRYSNEYARYVYMAAELADRKDVMKALEPTLKEQMRTWWDLLSPDGYGYPWGRSLGAISYMDTMEIVGFLGEHPQFRPAPMPQLASAYYAAWQWLSHDVLPDRHLLNVFGFGRGNYGYINKEREWQQTAAFLGKVAGAHFLFERTMRAEGLDVFPSELQLPDVTRFAYFRKAPRPAGVWLVRQPEIRFALPITTETKPGTSDYLPAPYNLTNFAPPVEQILPVVTPFLTLSNGKTIVASGGADEIEASPNGMAIRAVWRHWATIGGKAGDLTDPGIVADVRWELSGASLIRTETLFATSPVKITHFAVVVPTTTDEESTISQARTPVYEFRSTSGTLQVSATTTGPPFQASLRTTGDTPLGRGSRGPIPLLLKLDAEDININPGTPLVWTLRMSVKSYVNNESSSPNTTGR